MYIWKMQNIRNWIETILFTREIHQLCQRHAIDGYCLTFFLLRCGDDTTIYLFNPFLTGILLLRAFSCAVIVNFFQLLLVAITKITCLNVKKLSLTYIMLKNGQTYLENAWLFFNICMKGMIYFGRAEFFCEQLYFQAIL